MSTSRYPIVIFYRHDNYSEIDDFIENNKESLMCSIHITNDISELNKLYNHNHHLLVTYGDTYDEYNYISSNIPQRFSSRWFHKNNISNIEEFNENVNYCYITNVIDNREKTRPIFSLFTTCFKSYDYINTAYESIKKQTLKDWEWVIMDDTPEDEHFTFLRDTLSHDNRIRLYKRDKNSGNIGNVKNEAISLCRGKYVLEMDHDDEILKDCLLDSYNIFQSDPEIGFVYGDTIHLFRDGQNCKYTDTNLCKGYGGYYSELIDNQWRFIYNTPNINNVTLSHLCCLPNHPRIWNRAVLMELENYSEYLPICDDYEILLRTCCSKYKVVKNNKAQYIQYMNNEGNNFSTIRNSEINRIGPKYISPMFYAKYGVQDKMKELDAYEDPQYVTNQSDIWKRGPEYQHKIMNSRINLDYNKQYCIINDAIDNNRLKELYQNSKNDFLVLSNKITTQELWVKLNSLGFGRMKCYCYKGCSDEELIKYFKMMYKNDNCDYEIIQNINTDINNNNEVLNLSSLNVNYFKDSFVNASPFKHIILDNIINENLLNSALTEINNIPESELLSDYVLGIENVQINKFCYRDFNKLKYITCIKDYFESDTFIDWLEQVTGIDNLQKDTTHNGGGIHIIKQNGKLAIHSDFNRHRTTMKYRRLNLLLYLNKDYQEDYNGHLELWNKQMTSCEHKISPLFNRIVLFKVDDDANHGHPEIWNSENSNRTSLALYYYTDDRPEHEKSENYNAVWKCIQNPKCYIIHNNTVGGAYKFLTDTMKMYPNYEYIFIDSKHQLMSIEFKDTELFILQNVLYTDIEITDIINVYNKYNFKLIIQIHDFQWLCQDQHQYTYDIPSAYLSNDINVSTEITELLLLADKVVMNSQFTHDVYSKHFDSSNFTVCYPSDYNIQVGIKNIPEIQNKCMNIGVFSPLCKFKGERYVNYLKSKYECDTIQFQIVGQNIPYYKEVEFYDFIRKYNINGFLLLNEWGETYGYLLTKIINSGLPLLYNNFGAVKERFSGTLDKAEHYFKVYDNEHNDDVTIDYSILESQFNQFVKYINTNAGTVGVMNEDLTIKSRPVYDELFINKNYTLEPSMSNDNDNNTILIYTGFANTSWNYTYLQTNSIGGSEKAVAYLGKELSSKYKVIISGDVIDEIVDNVEYVNASKLQLLLNTQTFHTIIISRYLCFFEDYPFYSCKNLYVCSHDSHGLINRVWNNSPKDISNINNILVKNNKNITGIVALTEWHKNKLIEIYPSIKNKTKIINNGIQLEDFTSNNKKIPNKFIWSSCSDRGLSVLLNMWKDILYVIPGATLDICSYHPFPSSNEDFKMNEVILSNETITHHGKLNTNELYELMSKSEYWLYTNTVEESSCITALEMLMNEVVCLYYPIAGLNDTLGNYGIPVNIGEEIQSILNLTTETKNILKKEGKEYASSCSWKNRANEWTKMIDSYKEPWVFYCSLNLKKEMVEQYIDNLNIIYPEYFIYLTNNREALLINQPKKITFVYEVFDSELINQLPNTEFSFLNTEPLNLKFRLDNIINTLNTYPNWKYYDYSKSNLKILKENNINMENKLYLPYTCGKDELTTLINLNAQTNKEYDFGIINGSNNVNINRRQDVVNYLKENNYTINIISGWGLDRDKELAKCKTILNIHGFLEVTSLIFEHIRCDRLLEAGFNVLSETSYKLDELFVNKYPNLKQINYEDFFNVDVIHRVLHRNICFIHSCHLKNKGLKRLEYLIDKIKTTGLIHNLETIYINNIGIPIQENIYGDKFKICNYSDNPALYEIPTINKIHQFSKENTNCNIVYLHTKGISYDDNNQKENDWIDMMLYFLVERFELCLEKLQEGIQAVGCNYYDEKMKIRNPKCFAGNFWWAKSQYISKLHSLIEKTENVYPTDAEFWLCKNNQSVYELHNSKINHYNNEYPEHKYKQIKIRDYRYDVCNKGQSSGLDLNKYVKNCIDIIGTSNITNICDIGCGMGEHSKLLLSQYPNLKFTGIDWSQLTINYLNNNTSFFHEIVHCKSNNLPFNNKQFSVALCMENLEHLYANDCIDAFKELKRISEYIIITIPRPEYIVNRHWLTKEISEASNDIIPLSFTEYIALESCVHKTGYYETALMHAGFKKCHIEHPYNGIYFCESNELDISKIQYTGIDSNNLLQTSNYKEKYIDLLHKSLNLNFIQNQPKIIDCFIFYNELDLLTYRLNILNDTVDYFVLVEATHTFVGKEKPLFYQENKHLFEKFNHKIIHVIVDDFPHKYPNIDFEKKEQWNNEKFQRNCISRGIDKLELNNDDLIIIADVDEIPNPHILKLIKSNNIIVNINILELDFYYYNLNSKKDHLWHNTKILTFKKYKELKICCEDIRFYKCPSIQKAGWHLSYFGDENFIKNKIKNFSHQEYNHDTFTDEKLIEERIKTGKDLFGRENNDIINIPIEENDNLPPKYDVYLTNFYQNQNIISN